MKQKKEVMNQDSQTLRKLSKQYIQQIRLANRSLNFIIENTKAQTYTSSPQRSLAALLGLATSQARINELFTIANAIFPPNLDDTADNQDWEDIDFLDNNSDWQQKQVGLEHIFSNEYYTRQPTANTNINLTWSKLPKDLENEPIGLNLTSNLVISDVNSITPLLDAVVNSQQEWDLEQISSPNTYKPIRKKRYAEMTTHQPQQLIALAPAAAPVISSFMSKLLCPMARAIINRESTSDDHKHRIINSFIPAAISRTKHAALNIRRALNSKQYDSAITSLGQHIRDVDD